MIHGHCSSLNSSWEGVTGAGGACLEGVLRWTPEPSAQVPVAADLPISRYLFPNAPGESDTPSQTLGQSLSSSGITGTSWIFGHHP